MEACTLNVSSGGFYCRSPEPFSPGDNLTALLDLPSVIADRDAGVVLRCDVRVLRLETVTGETGWGIACQIEDYSIVRATNINTGAGLTEAKRGIG